MTHRASAEQVEYATGDTPPELQYEDLDDRLLHIWEWFRELSGTRQNGMSINPISHTEIYAWAQLMGIRPASWEVSALKAIDSTFMAVMMEDK